MKKITFGGTPVAERAQVINIQKARGRRRIARQRTAVSHLSSIVLTVGKTSDSDEPGSRTIQRKLWPKIFIHRLIGLIIMITSISRLSLLCFVASALIPTASHAKDDTVEVAVKRLAESGSYEWRTEIRMPLGPNRRLPVIEGKYSFAQGAHLKLGVGDKVVEVAAKDGAVVAKIDEDWKPAKKFTRSDQVQEALRGLIAFRLPHQELESLVARWRTVRKQDDGSYEGVADASTAGKILATASKQGSLPPGMQLSVLKVRVWLENGLPGKYALEFSTSAGGIVRQPMSFSVLTTLSNVGSTNFALPPEAIAALQTAPKR